MALNLLLLLYKIGERTFSKANLSCFWSFKAFKNSKLFAVSWLLDIMPSMYLLLIESFGNRFIQYLSQSDSSSDFILVDSVMLFWETTSCSDITSTLSDSVLSWVWFLQEIRTIKAKNIESLYLILNVCQLLYNRTGSDISFIIVSLVYLYPKESQRNEWCVKHPFGWSQSITSKKSAASVKLLLKKETWGQILVKNNK